MSNRLMPECHEPALFTGMRSLRSQQSNVMHALLQASRDCAACMVCMWMHAADSWLAPLCCPARDKLVSSAAAFQACPNVSATISSSSLGL